MSGKNTITISITQYVVILVAFIPTSETPVYGNTLEENK